VEDKTNYLQGFINQFQEELDPEDWDALLFLQWLDLNGYKIIRNDDSTRV